MTKMRIRLRVIGVTCFRRDADVPFTLEIPRCRALGTEKVRSKSGHNGSSPCLQTALHTGDKVACANASLTGAIKPNPSEFCTRSSVLGDTPRPDADSPRSGHGRAKQRRLTHPSGRAPLAGGACGPSVCQRRRCGLRARAARDRLAGALGRVDRRRLERPTCSSRWRRAPWFWCVRALRMLAPPELVWALPSMRKASRGAA